MTRVAPDMMVGIICVHRCQPQIALDPWPTGDNLHLPPGGLVRLQRKTEAEAEAAACWSGPFGGSVY